MSNLKRNVSVFDADARENAGYRYTTGARFSSVVANRRMTEATIRWVGEDCRSILDAGCGDGTYSAEIKRARPAVEVVGFDPAKDAIDVARARCPDAQFMVGDVLRPETFPDRRFDLAIVRGVLHHLSDPVSAIVNCGRLSDTLLIIEPNGNNPILKIIEKVSPYHRAHEEQSFSSARLTRWCRASGYEPVATEFIGFVPFFCPTALARIIYFLQPALERVPLLCRFFGAQIVILCRRAAAGAVP